MLSFLTNLIFPPECLGCRTKLLEGEALCEECFLKIGLYQTLFCGQCRARLPRPRKICHQNFPYLLGAAASYSNESVRNLILNLKFKGARQAAEPLIKLLAAYSKPIGLPWEKFLVIPIPLSRERLRERDFNQAFLIARGFANHFGLEVIQENLVRIKNNRPQSETKTFMERQKNVVGVFKVIHPEVLKNRPVFLVDDVTTSGATFLEATLTLKRAGVRKVVALAVAK